MILFLQVEKAARIALRALPGSDRLLPRLFSATVNRLLQLLQTLFVFFYRAGGRFENIFFGGGSRYIISNVVGTICTTS